MLVLCIPIDLQIKIEHFYLDFRWIDKWENHVNANNIEATSFKQKCGDGTEAIFLSFQGTG